MSEPSAPTQNQFWQTTMSQPLPPPQQQAPNQQAPDQQAPATAPVIAFPPKLQADIDVLWHLSNLMNASIGTLTAYLCLEPLARAFEEARLKPLVGVVAFYHPNMLSQAALLHDLSYNVSIVLDKLMLTDLHKMVKDVPPYNTLINGASSLRGTTINIPTGLMVQQGLCRNVPYPTREMILELRRACNDLSEMCHGNAAKGIAGWKNCWDEVEPTLRTE